MSLHSPDEFLWVRLPDGLFYRLAYDIWGGSRLGEGGQADHPFDRFVVFTAGAQQVEESGQEDHLHINGKQSRLFNLYLQVLLYTWIDFTQKRQGI